MKKIHLLLTLLFFTSLTFSQNRLTTSINECWQFKKEALELGAFTGLDDSEWETINLPHTWNIEDVIDEIPGYYRGEAWYRKTIKLSKELQSKQVFLYFEGASQEAYIFVNGKYIGKHYGSYTAFSFDISKYLTFKNDHEFTDNQIAVKISNKHNENIPPLQGDFTFFGGIHRDVHLIVTEKVHFDLLDYASKGIYIQTPKVSNENATVSIKSLIKNDAQNEKNIILKHIIVDKNNKPITSVEQKISLIGNEKQSIILETQLESPNLWSPESPYLYSVVSQIIDEKTKKIIDQTTHPLGLRWYSIDPEKGFFLNGKHYKLIGANRHQDYKGLSSAMPDKLHIRDMEMLKEMGANFIRIAHYPQDNVLLETCDRLGIIAWEEIPVVNEVTLTNEFDNTVKTMLREMIKQHYNHPCVVMWGIMNEITMQAQRLKKNPQEQEKQLNGVTKLAKELNRIAKTEDPKRLTAIAHQKNYDLVQKAGLCEITDVIGWNIYYGWYSSNFNNLTKFLDDFHAKHPKMPIIVSEYGAGSDPRIHSNNPVRFDFSTEWQNMYHESYLQQMLDLPYLVGGTAWNFVDFQSGGRIDAVPNINSKGLLTTDRRKKDAYFIYQAYLSPEPMLHIATNQWQLKTDFADAGKNYSTQKITIYTNQKEVELFLNNQSLGIKKNENRKVEFEVPFVNGKNLLEAVTKTATKTIKDFSEVTFQIQPEKLSDASFNEIAVSLGSHYYFVDDKLNQVWLPDKEYSKDTYGYTAGKVFTIWNGYRIASDRDIIGTDKDPIYQTQRDSLSKYKFDVPNGKYEITLYFAELLSSKQMEKAFYNLGADEGNTAQEVNRVFDVLINKKLFIQNLNLAEQYGEHLAVNFKTEIMVTNNQGITIHFNVKKGNSALNAIKIRKI